MPEPPFTSGPRRGGRQREGGAGPEAPIQGLLEFARVPPNPPTFPRTPRPEVGGVLWTSPLGEYLRTTQFSRQSQPTELLPLQAKLEGELGWPGLRQPGPSHRASRVLHQLQDGPLLPAACLALGPSPTQPQTQESSLLWFLPHLLVSSVVLALLRA